MAILRCTQKLLSELKLKPSDSIQQPSDLSGWHANLLRIDRRKCVLFTHDTTLYSFFVPGLKKPDFENIREVFGQNLFKSLMAENLPQKQKSTSASLLQLTSAPSLALPPSTLTACTHIVAILE